MPATKIQNFSESINILATKTTVTLISYNIKGISYKDLFRVGKDRKKLIIFANKKGKI